MLTSISSLELLPDELFYDIFDYLSAQDLYDGFYDLNTRFRSILASLTKLYGEITTEKEIQSSAFHFFASRITILHVEHVEPIDVSPFSAIRSLKLRIEPNRAQCRSIQLLPHLEYLSVSKPPIEHCYYSNSLSFFVFTNLFPSLHSCRLNLIPYKDNQQWTLVPLLHTLDICVGDPRVYTQILHSCSSLVRLRLEFMRYFARPPEAFQEPLHTSLRRFDLSLNSTTFSCCQIIDLLLSLVPNLTYFSVKGSSSDANYINIDSLAIILHQRLPKLRQFYLDMPVQELLVDTIRNDNRQKMYQLHPLFNYIKINRSTKNIPARLIIASKEKMILKLPFRF
jgi:hypothetical protein